MSINVTTHNNDWLTVLYNDELEFQFKLREMQNGNKEAIFRFAHAVIKTDGQYRKGGNSERTSRYRMPHVDGHEDVIPRAVINKLKELNYLSNSYPQN